MNRLRLVVDNTRTPEAPQHIVATAESAGDLLDVPCKTTPTRQHPSAHNLGRSLLAAQIVADQPRELFDTPTVQQSTEFTVAPPTRHHRQA